MCRKKEEIIKDALYEDIGAKNKTVAKWGFGVESVIVIITGLIMFFYKQSRISPAGWPGYDDCWTCCGAGFFLFPVCHR